MFEPGLFFRGPIDGIRHSRCASKGREQAITWHERRLVSGHMCASPITHPSDCPSTSSAPCQLSPTPIIMKPDPQQSWTESKCLNRISSDKAGKWLTSTEISDISQHTPRKPIEYSSLSPGRFVTGQIMAILYSRIFIPRTPYIQSCAPATVPQHMPFACHCKAAAAPTLCILPENMLAFPVHSLP